MVGGGWRLARSRGAATQLPLAICAVLAVVIALLGKAEASIFDNARAKITDWSEPVLAGVQGPFGAVGRWLGGVSSMFTVYRENLQLKEQNAELRKWQDVAASLEQKLKRYELLLKAVPDPELPTIVASVIGQSSRPFARTMILDAGTDAMIRKGQAVLDDRGLIGRVIVTGQRTSWVMLLGDLNSRVPVVIQPSNRRAILTGDNGVAPRLDLDLGDAPVSEGDRVISTGDGGLLPPGLPVGIVMKDGGSFRVVLYADPTASDFVHIVDYHADVPPAADQTGDVPDGPLPAVPAPLPEPALPAGQSPAQKSAPQSIAVAPQAAKPPKPSAAPGAPAAEELDQ